MSEWRTYQKKPLEVRAKQVDERVQIDTREGTVWAEPGDYVVEGVEGELYPCGREIFEQTYREPDERSMTAAKDVGEVYHDRNLLALAFIVERARLQTHPYPVGWYEHDEWAVLFAELPNGPVSWHVRPDVVPDFLPKWNRKRVFDGHTRLEKNDRLLEYAKGEV